MTSNRHNKQRQTSFNLLCWAVVAVSFLSSIAPISGFLSPQIRAISTNRRSGDASTLSSTSSLNYKKVFVAGGSRGVGHLIVEKLSKQGTEVVALVRREESKEELDAIEGVTAILGDAFEQKDIETAMDGCDVAITMLGGKTGDRRVDYEGNNNVIESAGILGVQRIILITSIGCGSSRGAASPKMFEILKESLVAKEKAENILIDYYTNSNWSIIRPGGLKSEPRTGTAIVTEDTTAIGSIHREDMADLVIRAIDSPNTERKVLAAVDPGLGNPFVAGKKELAAFQL